MEQTNYSRNVRKSVDALAFVESESETAVAIPERKELVEQAAVKQSKSLGLGS
jgi:hypothetical protein